MAAVRQDSLAGRRVLITGGSSGIGLTCAHDLTRAGARVAVLSRGGEALDEAASGLGSEAIALRADVTKPEELADAMAQAATAFGGLDAVVANAGAATYGPFTDMAPDDYRQTIDTTLVGVLNTARAALPHLAAASGTLVVVGSVAGRVPVPWLASYTAAKHGVRGFARALRAELRAGGIPVAVALVAPGPVDTPFWKRSRTTDGRLPPRLVGVYEPEAVAAEVVRSIRRPRAERTVGGLMTALAAADAVAPDLTVRALGLLARLGWRNRAERPTSPADGLARAAETPRVRGDLPARPSATGKVRDRLRGGR